MNLKKAAYIVSVQRTINIFNYFIEEKNKTFAEIEKLEKYHTVSSKEKSEIIKQLNKMIDPDNIQVQHEIEERMHNLHAVIGSTIIRYIEDVENTADYLENIDSIHDSKSSRICREILGTALGALVGILIYKYFF